MPRINKSKGMCHMQNNYSDVLVPYNRENPVSRFPLAQYFFPWWSWCLLSLHASLKTWCFPDNMKHHSQHQNASSPLGKAGDRPGMGRGHEDARNHPEHWVWKNRYHKPRLTEGPLSIPSPKAPKRCVKWPDFCYPDPARLWFPLEWK